MKMAILGVWMWPVSVRVHGAEKVVRQCKKIGVTDIYFLTKGLTGETSFQCSLSPNSQRDYLSELIAAAHPRSIRVHAWFTSASDEHYKELHPESGRFHYSRGRDKGLISLWDEGYLSYMEKVTKELCRGYEIDGLHLDYIRYNHVLYGWSDMDAARYQKEGAHLHDLYRMIWRAFYKEGEKEENCLFDAYRAGDESVLAMARVRRNDVRNFAQRITSCARAEKSGLILSAALMPEGAYEDTAFADVHYGQNYEDAAKLYDYALPMAYSRAYEKDGAWVKMVAEGTMKRGLSAVMGLHAYEGGTGLTLKEDMEALRDLPIKGICLFREGANAFACPDGKKVSIYNALPEPITCVKAGETEVKTEIASGEEKDIEFPFIPESLQVFCGEKECSLYLAR